jgi:superfamily II DNA or RNA helicase
MAPAAAGLVANATRMSQVTLTQDLMARLAGWEVVQEARSLLASGRVIESDWQPPRLLGVVRGSNGTHSAGLLIRSATDADNLCPCRASRQRGLICAHSIAVGLHRIRVQTPLPPPPASPPSSGARPATTTTADRTLRRVAADQVGEPLILHIILPPNFAEAVTRGRTMLYLEGSWRSGRSPLNALPRETRFRLEAQDTALLDAIETLARGETPSMIQLDSDSLSRLLPLMVGHPHVTRGKSQPVEVLADPARLGIRATLKSGGEIRLDTEGTRPSGVIGRNTPWVWFGESLRPLGLPPGLVELLAGPVQIPRPRVPPFLLVDWPELVARCDVQANFALEDFQIEPVTPQFRLHLAGGLAMLQASLECRYGEWTVTPGADPEQASVWLPDPVSPTRYRTRNVDAERTALARLMRRGFTGPDADGRYHLNGQEAVLGFFARDYPELEREWTVTLEERLERSTERNLDRIEPRFTVTPSGEQWFDLGISYESRGGQRFSAADIQRLLLSGRGYARLQNGQFVLLETGAVEELQEILRDCAPQQHRDQFRLRQAHAGIIDATLRQTPGWKVDSPESWSRRAAQQRGEVKLDPPPLGTLDSVLRPYQKHGVAWLQFLRKNGFGGVLADDMGLGKTVQVLAWLQSLRDRAELAGPTLVVCPTSLVFNWAAEAQKFTPALRVVALHGSARRERFSSMQDHDLVITSYALLRRDAVDYRDIEFDTVVLDEAQHIKNRQTQNAQAVKAIRSRQRLVLTGTPLENSVLDLWSIFDFLMPGYLGSAAEFRERYELPISRDRDTSSQRRLARRLRPFVLRRMKRDVAADLPEKIEQISYCELNDSQRATYQQVLELSRSQIVQAVDAHGLAQSRMLILTALLRLRQICCDLRLLDDKNSPTKPQPDPVPAGKVELFNELLEEIIDGGHRVLVFSQFTRMLGLLRDQLQTQGLDSCYLDGATRDRADVVRQFQTDTSIPVFLISLKAGGVGLNLTGADTVIHFDPWWNPAVEAQATDRAHRIGQKQVVTSYKLITRGTVEEKILRLQERKRALIEGTLSGEEQLAQALSWEEIQDLLQT